VISNELSNSHCKIEHTMQVTCFEKFHHSIRYQCRHAGATDIKLQQTFQTMFQCN